MMMYVTWREAADVIRTLFAESEASKAGSLVWRRSVDGRLPGSLWWWWRGRQESGCGLKNLLLPTCGHFLFTLRLPPVSSRILSSAFSGKIT